MAKAEWVDERTAAGFFGWAPRTLRRYVKAGKVRIAYTTVTGKNIHYNKLDIDKLMIAHSNL
jgi:predicted site-specific integrase-resolvase